MTNGNVILIVEDERDDLNRLKKALVAAGIKNPVHTAADFETAINYLTGQDRYANRKRYPLPVLVLLDLGLPGKGGLEALARIRNLKIPRMPVIVLTSSTNPERIKAAYEAGAASYIMKPATSAGWMHFATLIKEYWLGYNLFPPIG